MGVTGAAITLKQPHTTLRFESNQKLLNKNKRACKNRKEYYVINPTNWLMDFMLVRETYPSTTVDNWGIWNYETGVQTHIGNNSDLHIKTFNGYDYITWIGLMDNGFSTMQGRPFDQPGVFFECGKIYQVRINDGVRTYYSEPFIAQESDYDYDYEYLLDDRAGGWTNVSGGGGAIVDNQITKTGFTSWRVSHYIPGNFFHNFGELAFQMGTGDFMGAGTEIKIYFDDVLKATITENTARPKDDWWRISGYFAGPLVKVDIEFNAPAAGVMDNLRVFTENYGIKCHTKLKWTNSCGDVGNIPMSETWDGAGQFTHYFWFDMISEISDPAYKLEREQKEDGNGERITKFVRREKRYQIETDLVPEYIVDLLFDIQLYDTRYFFIKDDVGIELMTDVEVKYQARFEKCYYTVQITFGVGDDVTKGNCCDEIPQIPCREVCDTEVVGILEDEDTPTEGFHYISNTYGQVIVEYHASGNTIIPCATGWIQIIGSCEHYFFDIRDNQWHKIGVSSVVKEDQYNLNDTRCYVFAYIPPGFYAKLGYTPSGGSYTEYATVYSPDDFLNGVLLDAGNTEFEVVIGYFNNNCSVIIACIYPVEWGLRLKLTKTSIDTFYATNHWSFLQFLCIPFICTLRPSNILVPDLAALEAAIEGGVCAGGAYDFTSDTDYYYIEKTDSDIFLDCVFNFMHTDDMNTTTYIMLVYDRLHLADETAY